MTEESAIIQKIQKESFPELFSNFSTVILERILYHKKAFICKLFNSLFNDECKNRKFKKIKYRKNEFDYTVMYDFEENRRMIFIGMPEPRKQTFSKGSEESKDLFVKYYCIPYCTKRNIIEIYNLHSVETPKNKKCNFLSRYENGFHIYNNSYCAPFNVDEKEKIQNYMFKYIFETFKYGDD